MGGRGSGGHNSKRKLRDVQCARLDVHELARDGRLTLGTRGRLFGTVGFEVVGGPDAQRLVLEFPMRSATEGAWAAAALVDIILSASCAMSNVRASMSMNWLEMGGCHSARA